MQRCLDLGVTFIDTANGYTTSEERIGQAIAALAGSAVRREQVVIATKTSARDKAGAQEHLELSWKHLQTNYIGLWQFHGVSTFEGYERVLGPDGAMEAAQTAVQAGKVRHIGITSHSQERQEIERIRAEIGTRFCRRCEHCQPCPEGVRISLIMNLLVSGSGFLLNGFPRVGLPIA